MGTYPHGLFSYADIGSGDLAAGERFYSKLFGWEIRRSPVGPDRCQTWLLLDGEVVAGLREESPERRASREGLEVPPMWQPYVTVDGIDSIVDLALRLGGSVVEEPAEVGSRGRAAMVADPEGATVGVWQEIESPGATVHNLPGAITWNELATRDVDGAMDFYARLLGWKFESEDEPMPYHTIMVGQRATGGVIEMNEDWPDSIPAHWMVYFGSFDVDSSVVSVESLGGTVSVPPTDIPRGRFAVVHDDQGGLFSLLSLREWH